MILKEHEGKALFKKYRIPIPKGFLITGIKGLTRKTRHLAPDFVLKPQVLTGRRGKRGGIIFANQKNIDQKARILFGKKLGDEKFSEILIEEKLEIKSEFYLSIAIDRFYRNPVLIFSKEGGVDIENLAKNKPSAIYKVPISKITVFPDLEFTKFLAKLKIKTEIRRQIFKIAKGLFTLFTENDATLAEINPLAVDTREKVIAVDAKVMIDDNAIFRNKRFQKYLGRELSALENSALKHGLSYVEMDGNLAIIGNGAGLTMATLDTVKKYGGHAANFCDVGGGASDRTMSKALEIVLKKKSARAVLINIFGGITRCDQIARGLAGYLKGFKINLPLVVRLTGTNETEAKKILHASGITSLNSFDDACKKAAILSKKNVDIN
jgi:succinyl-CoA synthetase beta subunit